MSSPLYVGGKRAGPLTRSPHAHITLSLQQITPSLRGPVTSVPDPKLIILDPDPDPQIENQEFRIQIQIRILDQDPSVN